MKRRLLFLLIISLVILTGFHIVLAEFTPEFKGNIGTDIVNDLKLEQQQQKEQLLSGDKSSIIHAPEADTAAEQLKNIAPENIEQEAGTAAAQHDGFQTIKQQRANPQYQIAPDEFKDVENLSQDIWRGVDSGAFAEHDCNEVGGGSNPPNFVEQVVTETITEHDVPTQRFCEQLQNEFHCKETLHLRCADPTIKGAAVNKISGDMVHYYNEQTQILTIGVPNRRLHHDWGAKLDVNFVFGVEDAAAVNSFTLISAEWADYLLVTVNNQVAIAAPSNLVRDKMEMSYLRENYRICSEDGQRYYGVDTGIGHWQPANTKKYHSQAFNKELKGLLRNGDNILRVQMVYGRGGQFSAKLKYNNKGCNRWDETKEEICQQILPN